MKKLLALLVLLCLCCTMVACGNKNDDANEEPKEEVSETPCEDYLWNDFTNQGTIFKTDWLLYSWTKNNLDAFKNPVSVEFTGNAYYYENSSGEIEFFLVEYRADNSFGGKTVSYMKLTEFSLTSTDGWTPTFISPSYEGKSLYTCGGVSTPTKDALKEYQDLNY